MVCYDYKRKTITVNNRCMHIFHSQTEFTQTPVHEDNSQGGVNCDPQSQEEVPIHDNQDGESDSEEVPDIVNVDEVVEEALSVTRVQTSTVDINNFEYDIQIQSFLTATCGCQLNGGQPCSTHFSCEQVKTFRLEANELSNGELDLVIMGKLSALSRSDESQQRHTMFLHGGHRVCQKMFLYLHDIGEKRLKNLMKHFKKNGLTGRTHGNTSRQPHNAHSLSTVKAVVTFILNYSEQNSIALPGRIPGYSRSDIQLLPSSTSKKSIWERYQSSAALCPPNAPVGYSTFCRLWRTLVPQVITMKPMSDLCWTCQQNSTHVLRMANATEVEKSQALKNALEHLRIVDNERHFYKDSLEKCKVAVHTEFSENNVLHLPSPPQAPQSVKIPVHYSFDYAQQIHYHSNPLQPGPMYFLTCRKCSIFGVCCESIPRQVNFLTDEAADGGKGANAVISRLHYYFEHHGLGEDEAFLHADNCVGQNKNNAVMQYLMWRVMKRLHRCITISFLIVGHTKFSPDWCFGLFKKLHRRTNITSLHDIRATVEKSAKCNVAQLVAEADGSVIVPTCNWKEFLAPYFRTIPSIKEYQHFTFSSDKPGIVSVKKHVDTSSKELHLLKDNWNPGESVPNILPPKGLPLERQWYLYDNIRQFCPEETKDVVCPLPSIPRDRNLTARSTDTSQPKRSRYNN